jgi:hypothetical protein
MGFPIREGDAAGVLGTAWHPNHKILCAKEFAGDPTNNVTPDFRGQPCVDTSGAHLYWASTAAAAGWKKLNN